MKIVKKNLKSQVDERGELTVAEIGHDIPFEIKRVYFLKDLKTDVPRGFHAHKALLQVMYCLSGKTNVLLDDGKNKETVPLKAGETLFIDKYIWRVMSDFSSDCVLAVFASELYDEADYIRDYDQFLESVKARKTHG